MDKLPKTKAFEEDPFWWKYYRSFWEENGSRFVEKGRLYEQGEIGRDCFGLEWYKKATEEIRFEGTDKYSTRTCYPSTSKFSNQVCSLFMVNHYRGPLGDLLPGISSLGPNYYDPDIKYSGVTMDFLISLDEKIELSRDTFSCYGSEFGRTVMAGEVTPEGWGVVPMTPQRQGSYPTPFYQWVFIVPKGQSIRVGQCDPHVFGCTESHDGDAVIVDAPLSTIPDKKDKKEEADKKKFELLMEQYALGGIDFVKISDADINAKGFYYMVRHYSDGWLRSKNPIDDFNDPQLLEKIRECGCLTVNGSGNDRNDFIKSGGHMADAAGRMFNVHYYMPVAMGLDSYEKHDAETDLPNQVGQLADWAKKEGIRLDVRGHSWSAWLIWRACGTTSLSSCSNIDFTSYAPATLIENWDVLKDFIENFQGQATVVTGSSDLLSTFSLSKTEREENPQHVEWLDLDRIGHGIEALTKAEKDSSKRCFGGRWVWYTRGPPKSRRRYTKCEN